MLYHSPTKRKPKSPPPLPNTATCSFDMDNGPLSDSRQRLANLPRPILAPSPGLDSPSCLPPNGAPRRAAPQRLDKSMLQSAFGTDQMTDIVPDISTQPDIIASSIPLKDIPPNSSSALNCAPLCTDTVQPSRIVRFDDSSFENVVQIPSVQSETDSLPESPNSQGPSIHAVPEIQIASIEEEALAAFPNDDREQESISHYAFASDERSVGGSFSSCEAAVGDSATPEPACGSTFPAPSILFSRDTLSPESRLRSKSGTIIDYRASTLDKPTSTLRSDGTATTCDEGPKDGLKSPPMLGDDLSFPRCHSPVHISYTDWRSGGPSNPPCPPPTPGLWQPKSNVSAQTPQETSPKAHLFGVRALEHFSKPQTWVARPQLASPVTPNHTPPMWAKSDVSASTSPKGPLWGGCNAKAAPSNTPNPRPGLFNSTATTTTRPFLLSNPPSKRQEGGTGSLAPAFNMLSKRPVPTTPTPSSTQTVSSWLARCSNPAGPESAVPEAPAIASVFDDMTPDEIDDHFITQVYNFIGLGYPPMAREFDEELSKSAGISIDLLRSDDRLLSGKRGYVLLGDDPLIDRTVHPEISCTEFHRWQALKKYVLKWVADNPKPTADPHRGWNVQDRRDSWAG